MNDTQIALLKILSTLIFPWKNNGYFERYRPLSYPIALTLYFTLILVIFVLLGKLLFPLPMYKLNPIPSTIVKDRNGRIMRVFLSPDGSWRMPSNNISPNLKMAVINYEDKWFYYHFGINPVSLVRALITNLKARRIVRGGSTITMQLARMMEPKPRTIKSKIIEMIRAIQLELEFSKDEILSFYFNLAPYGGNIVGAQAASYFYFNKDQNELSLGEACLLAIIPKSPNYFRPDNQKTTNVLLRERNRLLTKLLRSGKITQEQYDEAISEPIPSKRYPLPFIAPQFSQKLKDMNHGSYELLSTIDINVQNMAQNILERHVSQLKAKGITNGSVVVMDTRTREVLAMVGSANFFDKKSSGQVNGAISPRSPGSALKPFVYALALDHGLVSPESMLIDVPVDYHGYRPENYDGKYRGMVSMRDSIKHSLNVPAVRLTARLGENKFYNFLKEAGITTLNNPPEHYGLSLILGGCEVTLLELTNLYCGLANMGEFGHYKLLLDPHGNIKRSSHDKFGYRRLLSEEACYIITEILTEVERPDLPTCWESAINRPKIAWKTGTSYGRKDAWSIGYSPQYTIGVWVGNFNGIGSPELVGSETAGPILFDVFNALQSNSTTQWYTMPKGVKERDVCSISGMLPTRYCRYKKRELYIPAVSPNHLCSMHKVFPIDKETGFRLCTHCKDTREYETKIFVVLPPEVATWLESCNMPVDKVPPHLPECPHITPGTGPMIRSPSADSEYIIRNNVDIEYQKILLEASVPNSCQNIYWFMDSKLIYAGPPTEKVFIKPTPGNHKLICMDEEGRSAEVLLRVR